MQNRTFVPETMANGMPSVFVTTGDGTSAANEEQTPTSATNPVRRRFRARSCSGMTNDAESTTKLSTERKQCADSRHNSGDTNNPRDDCRSRKKLFRGNDDRDDDHDERIHHS